MTAKQLIEKISSEMKDLSELEVEKILKMIHLVKSEFLKEKKKASIESFKKAKGSWKNIDVESIYKNLNEDWINWKPSASV